MISDARWRMIALAFVALVGTLVAFGIDGKIKHDNSGVSLGHHGLRLGVQP